MALSQHAYRRIAQKVQMPAPATVPWSAPSMSELIARIEAALAMRQIGRAHV